MAVVCTVGHGMAVLARYTDSSEVVVPPDACERSNVFRARVEACSPGEQFELPENEFWAWMQCYELMTGKDGSLQSADATTLVIYAKVCFAE